MVSRLIAAVIFLMIFPASATASDSSKITCIIERGFPYSDYSAHIVFSGNFNSRYWIIRKIHYKLSPPSASSNRNNFSLIDAKTKREYYSSPDSLIRSGRWKSYQTRFRVPKSRAITLKLSFDEPGKLDPDCYRDFAI